MNHGQRQHATSMRYEDIPKTYDQLCALYALRPIHNDMELDQATDIIDLLAGHDLNVDQADYLDALSTLVEAYENAHHPLDDPAICGLNALRALLDEHGIGATDLAPLAWHAPQHGIEIAEGGTRLTVRHLKILSERFKVSADLFLDH